jgi:hypothetical protein
VITLSRHLKPLTPLVMAESVSLEVVSPQYTAGEDELYFVLRVTCTSGLFKESAFERTRSWSDFAFLNGQLVRSLQGLIIPHFPIRRQKHWTDVRALESQRHEIEVYLRRIVQSPLTLHASVFIAFCEQEKEQWQSFVNDNTNRPSTFGKLKRALVSGTKELARGPTAILSAPVLGTHPSGSELNLCRSEIHAMDVATRNIASSVNRVMQQRADLAAAETQLAQALLGAVGEGHSAHQSASSSVSVPMHEVHDSVVAYANDLLDHARKAHMLGNRDAFLFRYLCEDRLDWNMQAKAAMESVLAAEQAAELLRKKVEQQARRQRDVSGLELQYEDAVYDANVARERFMVDFKKVSAENYAALLAVVKKSNSEWHSFHHAIHLTPGEEFQDTKVNLPEGVSSSVPFIDKEAFLTDFRAMRQQQRGSQVADSAANPREVVEVEAHRGDSNSHASSAHVEESALQSVTAELQPHAQEISPPPSSHPEPAEYGYEEESETLGVPEL